jgi:uracil-DNA glycosylase family 4
MPATDDEIREKYLERAIRELNSLTRELQSCPHCPRGQLMPVLGSGHPQADIMLLKHAPLPSEIEEGVAFYGRSGGALMKSFKRLSIDPLTVYGTLCVKCPLADASMAEGWVGIDDCVARVAHEIAIVQPRIVVVMGSGLERFSSSRRRSTRCTCRTSTSRWMSKTQSARSGQRFARSASGMPRSRLIEGWGIYTFCAIHYGDYHM